MWLICIPIYSRFLIMHLHSNMVLLQLDLFNEPEGCITNLHSNMVLLQSVTNIGKAILHLIYIPIWFYFNKSIKLYIFGYITDLHSNMVLLQWFLSSLCNNFGFIYIPIWFYFNSVVYRTYLFLSQFTFQYGSTSMIVGIGSWMLWPIYIPIWFYFNPIIVFSLIINNKIYIPIWFYFNGILPEHTDIFVGIYIPIWFYFNEATALAQGVTIPDLHSNMVLLQ